MSPWLPLSQLPLKTSVSSIAQFRFHPFADSFPHSAVWGGGWWGKSLLTPTLPREMKILFCAKLGLSSCAVTSRILLQTSSAMIAV